MLVTGLAIEDGRVTVTDLNSTNGTYLNETELEPMKSTDVPVGAEVTFGGYLPSWHALPG